MFWIGLHLEGSVAKWAKVYREKKKFRIELLRTSVLTEESSLSFPQSGTEESSSKIISGLDSSEVLLREIQIKIQDKQKLLKSLPFQLETQLPFPPEEAIVSIQISPGDIPKSSKVSFYAAKASVLTSHIQRLVERKAEPDQTSCTPAALWRFADYFFPKISDTLFLHVGPKTSTAIGILQHKPVACYSFSLGSELFSATMDNKPSIEQLSIQLKKELDRLLTFFQKKNKNPWDSIILTGNFSSFSSLKSLIKENLPPSIAIHECESIESYDATTLESYAIPIGLAFDGLAHDGLSTEFRQKEFSSSSIQKKSIKAFLTFALTCFILTCTTSLLSNMYLKQERRSLIENCQNFFSLSNKAIFSLEDLGEEISSLEQSLKKDKTPYALSLPLPNVSEVLAWLSTHPVLTHSSIESSEIDIKTVKYNLLKYPRLTTISAPYLAKVELEIEIPSHQIAKEFKESLHKDFSIVDSKKEISWEVKGSIYFVSFFLKPQPVGLL